MIRALHATIPVPPVVLPVCRVRSKSVVPSYSGRKNSSSASSRQGHKSEGNLVILRRFSVCSVYNSAPSRVKRRLAQPKPSIRTMILHRKTGLAAMYSILSTMGDPAQTIPGRLGQTDNFLSCLRASRPRPGGDGSTGPPSLTPLTAGSQRLLLNYRLPSFLISNYSSSSLGL